MFPDDYLELLGIVDASQFTNNLDNFLAEHGEGLLGMCFASDDIDALGKKFGTEPSDLKRLLELPEGAVEPRFRLLHPPPGTLPGLSGFFCQHLTPELMRRPEWLVHANGAAGIADATIAVADVAAAVRAYDRVFGENGLRFVQSDGDEGLIELAVRVAGLDAAAAVLEGSGVAFSRFKDSLAIAPDEACGVSLMLVAGTG